MRASYLALAMAFGAVAAAGCGGTDESSIPPAGGNDTPVTSSSPTPPTNSAGGEAAASTAAADGTLRLGKVSGQLPKDWKNEPPSSQFRLAQVAIPAAEGDSAGAQLLVFNFGPGDAGTVEANLKR